MFQPSTTNSPKFDPEIAEQSESTSYNWQKWAKWGLLSAGGIVLTTAVMYYGGPTLVAGLSSLAAGIASRFKEGGQETALSSVEQRTRLRHVSPLSTQLQLKMDGFLAAEERRQELIQSIEETEEWKKFKEELEITEDNSEEDDGDEHIPELLSPAVAQGKRVERLKSAEFDVFPSVLQHKREMSTIPTDGLIAYYPFNGNANDESGNGHDASLDNPILSTDRFDNSNSAYSFVSDYMSCPSIGTPSHITWSAWFKTTPNYSGNGGIIAGRGAGWIHITSGNAIGVLEVDYADWKTLPSGQLCNDGIWHFATLTYNKQIIRFYVDGVEKSSIPDTGNINYDVNYLWIGRYYSPEVHYYFSGSIDEVRFYDRALSLEEIQTLYHMNYWPLGVNNTHQFISYVEDDAQIKLDKMKVIAAELSVSLNLVLSDQNAGILGTTVTNSTVTPTFINGIWNATGAPIEINRLLTGLFFEPAPDYDQDFMIALRIEDEVNTPINSTIAVTGTPVNDLPILINNRLAINEGQTVTLTSDNLSATDVDNGYETLTFHATYIEGGRFELITSPGISITNFTQQQIIDGEVQFVHDGGEDAPRYKISVSDNQSETEPTWADTTTHFVNINDAPIIGEILDRNGKVDLAFDFPVDINDPDDSSDSLTCYLKTDQGKPAPSWINFNKHAHSIGGIPESVATSRFSFFAKDPHGAMSSRNFSINVDAQASSPSWALIFGVSGAIGMVFGLIFGGRGLFDCYKYYRQKNNPVDRKDRNVQLSEIVSQGGYAHNVM